MSEPRNAKPAGPWPAPFSAAFISQARQLLERRSVLVIVGPLGGSRNRLAADVAGVPEGPVWTRHVARLGEDDLRFFAVQQLLTGLHLDHTDTVHTAEAAARQILRGLVEVAPVLIIANADLCDPESIEVLIRLAAAGAIRLIATLTPETVSEQQRLLSVAEVIDIPPLDRPTISELLRLRFGAAPHPTVVELLVERTEGSYGVIREVSDAAFDSGMIVPVEGVLVVNPAGSAATADRLAGLWAPPVVERLGGGDAVSDVIHLTALLGELDLEEARRHLDHDTIDGALRHGTLRTLGAGLAFTSRAESTFVQRTMPRERQIELFDRFAGVLTSSLERPGVALHAADWWRTAGRLLPVELAGRAAREANLSGRHRRTLVYTHPDHNESGIVVEPIERAFALVELGDTTALSEMFASLEPSELTEDELLPYLRWTARLASGPVRARLVDQAIAATDPEEARRRAAVNTLAGLLERAFFEGGDELTHQLRTLTFSGRLSPHNQAAAFTALSLVQRHSGHPVQAVESAEFALQILLQCPETVSAFHLDVTRECQILALISAVDLAGAEQAIQAYSSGIFGHAGSGRMTTALRGLLELFRGDVQQALVNARLCLAGLRRHDPHQIRGWVEGMLAQILVQVERPDEAREMLEISTSHPADRVQHDLERRITQACAHDALAEPEEALVILAGVMDEARERGLRLSEIDAAVLSVQIGGPPHLPMLLQAVDGLVDPSGTPAIWQRFAWAARDYDIPALAKLADDLHERGAHLFAAEVAQYVLDMARRKTDLDADTRSHLQQLADPMSHRHVDRT